MAKTNDEKKSVRTSVTIPIDDHEHLEQIAEQKKVSVAWVVREAINEFLDRQSPLFRQGQ